MMPLTTEERERIVLYARRVVPSDSIISRLHALDILRYEATLRELESSASVVQRPAEGTDPRDFVGFKIRTLAEPIPEGGSYIKPDEGARRRDVGHESALSHGFVTSIRCAILHVARTRERFTSEHVVAELTPATIDALRAFPNALGACIRAEAKAGAIVPTGDYLAACRPEARKRRLAVWRLSGGPISGG